MLRITTALLWLSVALSFAYSKAIPSAESPQLDLLISRQNGQLPREVCWSTCELSSGCGGGFCSIGSLLARSDPVSSVAANVSIEHLDVDENPLHRRTFRYSSDQRDPPTRKRPTKGQSKSYVVPILNQEGPRDTYFGPLLSLFHDRGLSSADERAVSVQREFGSEQFQIGTNALMGCTIVILVSKTHVWMSHLWEAYSNGGDDSNSNRAFDERVVDFIKGRTVTNPAASPIMQNEPWRLEDPKKKNDFKVYIPPSTPGIDPNVFKSERGSQVSLYIMAPTIREATSNDFPLRYPNHVASIKNAIKEQLGGKKPSTYEYKYVTLDPDNVPADEKKMYETTRGTALFQYDPDSDGRGKRAWRLWLEDTFFTVDLS
ncbi:uncharacterized protein yc1106_01883 [Curvularia clavata]|uniref:Uncharacterized protein n=1 Tax=Curvularia clavata TaxID=95742 RepID=A0A9Q8Z272_CURCL|nr:uncharacterized protein yc1106_01883 [Curvularia clavata]